MEEKDIESVMDLWNEKDIERVCLPLENKLKMDLFEILKVKIVNDFEMIMGYFSYWVMQYNLKEMWKVTWDDPKI